MATYTPLTGKPYLQGNKSWYIVEGEITKKDVEKINKLSKNVVLVLKNTKGQNAETIKGITASNVEFSVIGGLNYLNKNKFRTSSYIARTIMKPMDLSKVISYFEKIESKIETEHLLEHKVLLFCSTIFNTLSSFTNLFR